MVSSLLFLSPPFVLEQTFRRHYKCQCYPWSLDYRMESALYVLGGQPSEFSCGSRFSWSPWLFCCLHVWFIILQETACFALSFSCFSFFLEGFLILVCMFCYIYGIASVFLFFYLYKKEIISWLSSENGQVSLYRLGPKYASESCKSSIRTIFLVLIFSYEYMFHFSILVLSLHLPVHLLSL